MRRQFGAMNQHTFGGDLADLLGSAGSAAGGAVEDLQDRLDEIMSRRGRTGATFGNLMSGEQGGGYARDMLPAIFGAMPETQKRLMAPGLRLAAPALRELQNQNVQMQSQLRQLANHPAIQQMLAAQNQGMVPGLRDGANILGGFGSPEAVNLNTVPNSVGATIIPVQSVGTVAAGGTQLIQVQPQQIFRGERLQYTGAANTFLITDFRIMNKPVFGTAGAVAADSFAPLAVLPPFNFPLCTPSGIIAIAVLNTSGAAANCTFSFWGSLAWLN